MWEILGKEYYNLPFKTKKEVLAFVNLDIKVCPYCGKVDCSLEHVEGCNYNKALEYEIKQEFFYK